MFKILFRMETTSLMSPLMVSGKLTSRTMMQENLLMLRFMPETIIMRLQMQKSESFVLASYQRKASMYIQYVDLVLGICMIYPSLQCESHRTLT